MSEVRAVIAGAGVISMAHAAAIAATPGLTLAAIVDLERAKADKLADAVAAAGLPRPAVFTQLGEALEAVDLVAVCTPSGTHAAVACQALEAGLHTVIEKPIDVSLGAARRIAAAAASRAAVASGAVCSVISQHRFDPSTVVVRRALEAGRLGQVTSGLASVAWWRSRSYYDSGSWRGTWDLDGGGALMNQGIHTADLLAHLCGRPVEVDARVARRAHPTLEVEDVTTALVTFESGAVATLLCTTAAYPGLTVRLQIHGSQGSAVIDNDELTFFHAADAATGAASDYGDFGEGNQATAELAAFVAQEAAASGTGTDSGAPGSREARATAGLAVDSHMRQYADIARAIATGGAPTVTVAQATDTLALVRAVYISAALGTPVTLDDVLATPQWDTLHP